MYVLKAVVRFDVYEWFGLCNTCCMTIGMYRGTMMMSIKHQWKELTQFLFSKNCAYLDLDTCRRMFVVSAFILSSQCLRLYCVMYDYYYYYIQCPLLAGSSHFYYVFN